MAANPDPTDRLAALKASRDRSDNDRLVPPKELRGAPDIAAWRNPTVWLFVATFALLVIGSVGYLTRALSAWVVIPMNALGIYFGFTVFHESVHRTAHRNRTVNDVMGWLPAALLSFSYPTFRICHLQHHAHTNDPNLDPDHHVGKDPAGLRLIWLLSTATHYRTLYYRHKWGSASERRVQRVVDAALIALIPLVLLTGVGAEFWTLYFAPLLVAGVFLFYTFDFLPHYPHDSTERYLDTRIQPGRVRHAVLLGQNYHLIHHLWVSVPWFRYRAVFAEVEPGLRAKGARIDG